MSVRRRMTMHPAEAAAGGLIGGAVWWWCRTKAGHAVAPVGQLTARVSKTQ
jgi:hypothetical protein